MYYQKGTGTITVSATGRVQRDHTTQLYTTHGGGTADADTGDDIKVFADDAHGLATGDMVLLSGGIDGGTISHVVELSEIIASANPKPRLGSNFKLPIIITNDIANQFLKKEDKDISKLMMYM